MKTPYSPLFATDFLTYKQLLSNDEIITVLTIASEVALLDKFNTDPSSLSPTARKYLEGILTALDKIKKKSEAGKKGGRPVEAKE
ncbi:MAG: hypothetical protein J5716_05375 [Alphaproteobacteria bacterium]|nr:hypothetical protein [Alphaproteobacteria bacterium]